MSLPRKWRKQHWKWSRGHTTSGLSSWLWANPPLLLSPPHLPGLGCGPVFAQCSLSSRPRPAPGALQTPFAVKGGAWCGPHVVLEYPSACLLFLLRHWISSCWFTFNPKPSPPSALLISLDGHPNFLVSQVRFLGAIFDSVVYLTGKLLTDRTLMTAADFHMVVLIPSMDHSQHSSSLSPR